MSGLFIGIAGRSGAGKDTLAERLVTRHGFVRVAIADPLKELTGRAFDLDREQLWGAGRDVVDARWELTPRQLYQRLGDALRGCHPEALTRLWLRAVEEHRAVGRHVVTPDIRLPLELDAVRAADGALWRVERPAQPLPPGGLHWTETALDARDDWDARLLNNGDIDALWRAADLQLERRPEMTTGAADVAPRTRD
jgi:hypothetical protein